MVTTQNAVNNIYGGTNFSGTNISGTVNSAGISLSAPAPSTNFVFSNSNGVTFGTNGSTVTATVATNYVATNFATTTTNGSVIVGTANTTGITLAVPPYITTATQSNQAFSAAGGSSAFQTLVFTNSGGVSWTNTNGSIAATVATTYRASNDAIGLNTAQTNVTWTVNSSGISINASGYAGTGFSGTNASGTLNSNGLQLSVAAGGGGGGIGAAAGTQTATSGTIVFSNSNGMTFGMSNSSVITASYTRPVVSNAIASVGSATNSGTATSQFAAHDHVHAGVFSVGVSTGGNTAGNTRVDVGQFVLAGGANITLSQATAANALNTISIVGAAGAAGSVNFSAGTTSNNLNSVVFSNANGVSFGLNGSTITGSVAAAGGAAQTISMFPKQIPGMGTALPDIGATAAGTTTGTIYFSPFIVDNPVSFNNIGFRQSLNSTAPGTYSNTHAHAFGLYTLNGSTLSKVSDFYFEQRFSQNSVTAQSYYWFWGTNSTSNSNSVTGGGGIFTGVQHILLYSSATSLATGNYWLAHQYTSPISSGLHTDLFVSESNNGFGININSFGDTLIRSPQTLLIGRGTTTFSNTSTIMPISFLTSNISLTYAGAINGIRSNVLYFGSI